MRDSINLLHFYRAPNPAIGGLERTISEENVSRPSPFPSLFLFSFETLAIVNIIKTRVNPMMTKRKNAS